MPTIWRNGNRLILQKGLFLPIVISLDAMISDEFRFRSGGALKLIDTIELD
jgi:hypothetical protein